MSDSLPTFLELAETKLQYAGPRDKTICIKVTINTARMMVERERGFAAGGQLGTCKLVKRPHPQRCCGKGWRPLRGRG